MGAVPWIVSPPDGGAADLAAALGVRPLTAALLRRRGISTVAEARRFLDPRLEDLADPRSLPGMDRAVECVAQALRAGSRIAVHGDYDVDGVSATAILLRGLRALGAEPLWHLPHRFHDGYGLGSRAVETFGAHGAALLIAADCGITAQDAVARARALGLDVVILDHHQPPADRPAAIIVDPRREGTASVPLCAAGMAFMFVRALRERLAISAPMPAGLVSLAALGTVADVVPLLDDNRRLAAAGLAEMRAAPLPGIKALAEIAGFGGPIAAWHIGWHLGPRLNAPGRLGDPRPSLHLLLTDDPAEARDLAQALDRANRERQEILDRTLTEAIGQAEREASAPALVLAGEGWHPGVVGLVAGRIAEQYRRPAVAIGLVEGVGRGSARSVEGFNLVEALEGCRRHLLGFGGHAMAAGLTVAPEAVAEFRRAFTALAAVGAEDRVRASRLVVDAEVRIEDLTAEWVGEVERLGPFGAGNPEPVLAARGVRALNRRVVGDGRHLRLDVSDGSATIEAIGFSMAGPAELLTFTEAPVDLAVVPERDPQSPDRVRLRVVALEIPGMDPERILADTGALVDRLFARAEDYLGGARYDGAEDAPALHTKVVGVTFDGRQQVLTTLRPGDGLRLVREPANPHDPHAVQVATQDGRALGYLRAPLAGRLSPSIDAGARYRATVSGITGGGDRTIGLNIFLERLDDGDARDARGSAAPRWDAAARFGGQDRAARLAQALGGGQPLSPTQAAVLEAAASGRPLALALSPGRGLAPALACIAALAAREGRCALVVAPLRRQVVHRADQLRARLEPLGLRVCALHGLQGSRERERVDAAVRAGDVDVIVASAEAVAGGRVGGAADRVAAVVGDRLGGPDLPPLIRPFAGAQVCLVNPPALSAAVKFVGAGATVVRDEAVRIGVRMVDNRNAGDRDAVMEEVLRNGEKTVVYANGREECVHLAARMRGRCGEHARLGYLHGGLPARVRQIVVQAFREGRLRSLVTTSALDEEALPPDVRHVVIASLPPDRERFADALGPAGFGPRPVNVTVLFSSDEVPARRRDLDGRAPDRALLASIYRSLRQWRGDGPFWWPDDAAWAHLNAALPDLAPATVDAALAIFEEAGLAAGEATGARSEVQLLAASRRDLAASLRYREGRRDRAAFEECVRWAFQATGIELLQAAAAPAGAGVPAGADAGAPGR
ncbi:MAG: single-stranded-DNA-specific exonuclease RecJ [Bacillati bacterium ANGP1]|uniref:Single-stranded-DNA-specific exonuclease RecJ n=1 Tax=Candidatus Segetimicrobium genomatis TaxID=2569760 RepID=A0A537JAN1_9BACT|nr:MAG: single-stranded-DNA-specific exonuclease RecJ [Terrabacteria group bacterium ANGP1]